MELEGLRETLDGQVAGLESEVEEVRGALGRARQEACEHHNNTLKLQKEIGRLRGKLMCYFCVSSLILFYFFMLHHIVE